MGPPGFWRTGTGLLSVGMLPLLASATRIPTCRIHTYVAIPGINQTFRSVFRLHRRI